MKYKVAPFVPSVNQKKPTSEAAAEQLQMLINKMAEEGWSYIRVESISTWVAPTGGCFGIGGSPGYATSKQMIVFQQSS